MRGCSRSSRSLAVVIALASAPGGIDGQVSKAWQQLTDPNVGTPTNTPDRLTATSSVRARYWDEALQDLRGLAPGSGAGAGAYGTRARATARPLVGPPRARLRASRRSPTSGWSGSALSLLGALAWIVARGRARPALRRRDRGLPWDAERDRAAHARRRGARLRVHSLIDWTWFVPGDGGSGAAVRRLGGRARAAARSPGGRRGLRRRVARCGAATAVTAVAALALVVVLALAICWAALQPVRAAHAEERRPTRSSAQARPRRRRGARRPPTATRCRSTRCSSSPSRRTRRATGRTRSRTLERAVQLQPANCRAWRRLGPLPAVGAQRPEGRAAAFRAAYFLDPPSARGPSDYLEAARAARATPRPSVSTTPEFGNTVVEQLPGGHGCGGTDGTW